MGTDVASHVSCAVSFHQQLKNIFFSGEQPAEKCKWLVFLFLSGPFYWPHLVHFLAALAAFISQDVLFWIRFSNLFYFAALVIGTYLLGKKVHSTQAGLLAAVFISLYPGIFGLSRKFGLDFPLTSIVCLAIYFLLSSEGFQNRRYSALFGIASGLGMLIKGQFLLFLAGPSLFVAVTGFMRSRDKRNYFFNLSFSAALAAGIAFVWWHKFFSPAIEAPRYIDFLWYKPGALRSFYFYLRGAFLYISPLFFAAFLLGLALYLKNFKKVRLFFLSWAALPCIFFLLFYKLDNERYIFPFFPALALITAIGILELASRKLMRRLIIFFILTGALQFFGLSYAGLAPPSCWMVHSPQKNTHRLIINEFNRIMQGVKPGRREIGIIEEEYFSGDPCLRLAYFLKLADEKNNVSLSADGVRIYHLSLSRELLSKAFLSRQDNYDFLIVFSQDGEGPDFSGLEKFSTEQEKEMAAAAIKKFKKFQIIKRRIFWPGEIYVFLLKKT